MKKVMRLLSIIEITIDIRSDLMRKRRPTHPGELLREEVIKPLNFTITEAARRLGISRKNLSDLLNEKISLSPEMAVRIALATRTSPMSWLGMQKKLDIWKVEGKVFHVIGFEKLDDNSDLLLEG